MDNTSFAIIAGMGANRVIGVDGALPWRLPEDMRRFKALTMGHAVIMGRKTHQSIGRPLPGRQNIVVSRTPGLAFAGCELASSLEDALRLVAPSDPLPFVIGGEALYRSALPFATHLFLTLVPEAPRGDARFPEFDLAQWCEVRRENGEREVVFVELVRRSAQLGGNSPQAAA
jgi:dihydrofolate reductase